MQAFPLQLLRCIPFPASRASCSKGTKRWGGRAGLAECIHVQSMYVYRTRIDTRTTDAAQHVGRRSGVRVNRRFPSDREGDAVHAFHPCFFCYRPRTYRRVSKWMVMKQGHKWPPPWPPLTCPSFAAHSFIIMPFMDTGDAPTLTNWGSCRNEPGAAPADPSSQVEGGWEKIELDKQAMKLVLKRQPWRGI